MVYTKHLSLSLLSILLVSGSKPTEKIIATGRITSIHWRADQSDFAHRHNDPNVIYIGGDFDSTIRISKRLYGLDPIKTISATITMSSQPIVPMKNEIFLIAERNADGSFDVRYWQYAKEKDCVPRDITDELGISAIYNSLVETGKIRCAS